jgi:hypothetical protein
VSAGTAEGAGKGGGQGEGEVGKLFDGALEWHGHPGIDGTVEGGGLQPPQFVVGLPNEFDGAVSDEAPERVAVAAVRGVLSVTF